MHHLKSTDPDTGKPEIISFYNSTKGGVDAMDEKCAKYSCSRRTRRWPMAIFYKLLDICSTNSYILYSSYPGNDMNRFIFVKKLASQLIENHLRERLQKPQINRGVKSLICQILQIPNEAQDLNEERLKIRKYC